MDQQQHRQRKLNPFDTAKQLNPLKTNKMKAKYNIHRAINMRSWRKGLVNQDSLNFDLIQYQNSEFKPRQFTNIFIYPSPNYGIYYPNVYGKNHSQYPVKNTRK